MFFQKNGFFYFTVTLRLLLLTSLGIENALRSMITSFSKLSGKHQSFLGAGFLVLLSKLQGRLCEKYGGYAATLPIEREMPELNMIGRVKVT